MKCAVYKDNFLQISMGINKGILIILQLIAINLAAAIIIDGSFRVQIDNGILYSITPLSRHTFLNLSSLQLRNIAQGAFDHVTHITSLDLSNNQINNLSETVFSRLRNLQQLSLARTHNNLLLDKHFQSLGKLKVLDFSESIGLMFSAKALKGLPDDCEIKFIENINFIKPQMFNVNESLQIGKQNLVLFNCSENFPDALNELIDQNNRFFECDESDYYEVNAICISDKVVSSVGLSNNNNRKCLTFNFPPGYLPLNNKNIKRLTRNWYRLPSTHSISTVNLNDNELTAIDENLLNNLPMSINSVCLKANNISALKNNVMKNKHIKALDLSLNAIQTIEKNAFGNLTSLVDLNLTSNYIKNLEFVSSLPKTLERLHLIDNNISMIPNDIFSHLTNLYDLDFTNNKIKFLNENTFTGLRHLSFLLLDTNALKTIQKGQFDHMPCMQVLSFRGNNIEFVEKGFARNLNNVRALYLDNPVKVGKFERGLLYGLPSTSTVYTSTYLKSVETGVFKNHLSENKTVIAK